MRRRPLSTGLAAAAVFLLGFVTPLRAAKTGTASGQFLKMGAGARYAAMGEAAVAVADDVNALFWNPANLSRLQEGSLSFMYGALVESLQYQYAAFGGPVGRLGAIGASAQSFSAGTLAETDDTGRKLGTLSPRDFAAGLGWGRRLFGRLSAGAGAKLVQSRIVHTASTWTGDAGLLYDGRRGAMAVAVRNIGGSLEYDLEEADLPLTVQAGAAFRLTKGWAVSADGIFPNDGPGAAAAGTELRLFQGTKAGFSARAGYGTRSKDVPGFEGLSAGLGWNLPLLDVDYAWVPLGDLGQTHRISLTMRLGRSKARPRR